MEEAIVPDLMAPPPKEPMSEPSSPITPWVPSLEDTSALKDVTYLRHMFPKTSDKFLLCALEEGDGDPAATMAWAMSINNASRVQGIICNAFLTASPKEVHKALLAKNGNATAAYTLLARKHQSAWDRDHFALLSQITRKLLVTNEMLAPEFHDPDPSYAQHEAKWWSTMIATKEYKVEDSAQKTANWARVSAIVSLTIDVTPWVARHVESLGAWRTDRMAFDQAMGALRTFHDVTVLNNYCANHPGSTDSTLSIVLALLEDSLASPGTVAWAVEHLSRTPQAYRAAHFHFVAYGANRCTLWNRRNQSLAMWRTARNPPRSDAQWPGDLSQEASVGPAEMVEIIKIADSSHGSQDSRRGSQDSSTYKPRPLLESATRSAAMTPKSAHPCSLPVSSSAAKYIDLAKRTKRQTRSASASGSGTPLEGLLQPTPKRRKEEANTASKN